jgi:chaperonin cofactor prefoldin
MNRRYTKMARGRKSLTLEEQLSKITTEIENMEMSLKELKKAKRELEEQIRINRLTELDDLIVASGKSWDEIRELIQK